MAWDVDVPADVPIIETIYAGMLPRDELDAAARETMAQAHRHGRTLLLADCTQLAGGHSIFDLYHVAESFAADDIVHRLKEAVVLPQVPPPDRTFEFWVTTCENRGVEVRLFDDRVEALAWLLS
jgi:hypothetical protein